MAFVAIFHNVQVISEDRTRRLSAHDNQGDFCGPFDGFCSKCMLKPVMVYEVDDFAKPYTFEDAYMANQEGNPTGARVRSLSVGDVVIIDGEAAYVDTIGFKPTTVEAVNKAVQRANQYDGPGIVR